MGQSEPRLLPVAVILYKKSTIMENSNYYEERAKKTFSSAKPENENGTSPSAKKDTWMEILKNVGIDAGIAVLGGGAGAAVLGRYSFLAGAALTTYAHYEKSDKLRTLGIGLMASSSMTLCAKQDPKAGMTENMIERLKSFGQELKRKLLLDKLMPEKQAPKAETKQTDDLKGTEQKKANDSATSTQQKTEANNTAPPQNTVNPEAEYLSPEKATTELSNPESEPAWSKKRGYDDEDFSSIEEKLY